MRGRRSGCQGLSDITRTFIVEPLVANKKKLLDVRWISRRTAAQ